VTKERFQAALQLLDHRGPDACGYLSHQTNQLGHKRLKIVDLDDRSNQPFWSADRRYVVIFNGEIYNYRELARKYDIAQRTSSDTEIIVELGQPPAEPKKTHRVRKIQQSRCAALLQVLQ
jgi:asparagine synthase (glutamine-hydrolysing)